MVHELTSVYGYSVQRSPKGPTRDPAPAAPQDDIMVDRDFTFFSSIDDIVPG